MGEHYLIDAILGVLYAIAAYKASPYVVAWLTSVYKTVKQKFHGLRLDVKPKAR
jgi:hypothetical protein